MHSINRHLFCCTQMNAAAQEARKKLITMSEYSERLFPNSCLARSNKGPLWCSSISHPCCDRSQTPLLTAMIFQGRALIQHLTADEGNHPTDSSELWLSPVGRSKETEKFRHTEPTFRSSTARGRGQAVSVLPRPPRCPQERGPAASQHPNAQYCSPVLRLPFMPCSGRPARTPSVFVSIVSCQPSPPIFFFFFLLLHFFKMEKVNPSPFLVPPCHVPKVPTNLQCPACTQPPLIAPAFSSGVSSAIATAAPPPPGNSHLHYHSLLQSRPQAPGSEQQLR